MKPGPFFEAVEAVGCAAPLGLLSPRGRGFEQRDPARFAAGGGATPPSRTSKGGARRVARHTPTAAQ